MFFNIFAFLVKLNKIVEFYFVQFDQTLRILYTIAKCVNENVYPKHYVAMSYYFYPIGNVLPGVFV